MKIAFQVPGANNTSVDVPTAEGMPHGGFDVVQAFITWGLSLIFVIAGLAAFLFLLWGGISWISSGGDKEKIESARNKIVYAIIGLIIILSSYLIVRTVGQLFGVNVFNLSAPTS
jgi:hypothetical protein